MVDRVNFHRLKQGWKLLQLQLNVITRTVKRKARMFNFCRPHIRILMSCSFFVNQMNRNQLNIWNALKHIAKLFLSEHKALNYGYLVKKMLPALWQLGLRMNIKIHFIFSPLDRFPDNLGDFSEEQGETKT